MASARSGPLLAMLAVCALAAAAAAAPTSASKAVTPKERLLSVTLRNGRAAKDMAKWVREKVEYPASIRAADRSRWVPRPGKPAEAAWPLGLRKEYQYLAPTAAEERAAAAFLDALNSTCETVPDNYTLAQVRIVCVLSCRGSADLHAAQWQSPIRNQYKRVTSASFAIAGALEAAYYRSKKIRVDLSEEYINWISMQAPPLDGAR